MQISDIQDFLWSRFNQRDRVIEMNPYNDELEQMLRDLVETARAAERQKLTGEPEVRRETVECKNHIRPDFDPEGVQILVSPNTLGPQTIYRCRHCRATISKRVFEELPKHCAEHYREDFQMEPCEIGPVRTAIYRCKRCGEVISRLNYDLLYSRDSYHGH